MFILKWCMVQVKTYIQIHLCSSISFSIFRLLQIFRNAISPVWWDFFLLVQVSATAPAPALRQRKSYARQFVVIAAVWLKCFNGPDAARIVTPSACRGKRMARAWWCCSHSSCSLVQSEGTSSSIHKHQQIQVISRTLTSTCSQPYRYAP